MQLDTSFDKQNSEDHYVVTGLFGSDVDFGVYKAPKLAGVKCLFFSNSDVIGEYAQARGWLFIRTFHPVLRDDFLETSLQLKWVKYLQFLNESAVAEYRLKIPKSVLYFDHKFYVTPEHVSNILNRSSDASLLIRKTPVAKLSIKTEIEAALPDERYSRYMEPTKAFVNNFLSHGARSDVTICNTGLIHYRDLAASKQLADRVYHTCQSLKQPECQIVWAVHAQAFEDRIDVIEWNDPLVGDIEWQDPKVYTADYMPKAGAATAREPSLGIVVAGFHRSGTSSVTGILHHSGISSGNDLMDANEYNPKGYYESWGLVRLHDRLMTSKGVDWATSLEQKAPLSEDELLKLRSYFDERAEQSDGAWCMKDPRIGRYIFEWKRAVPELKVLMLYRAPNASALSLQTRSIREFVNHQGTLELGRRFYDDPDLALRLWIEHNEAYVAFCQANPDDCLVVGHAYIVNGFDAVRAASDKFGVETPAESASRFMNSSLLSRSRSIYVGSSDLRERALSVWRALCQMDVACKDQAEAVKTVEDHLILDVEGKAARAEQLEIFAEHALKRLQEQHGEVDRLNSEKSELHGEVDRLNLEKSELQKEKNRLYAEKEQLYILRRFAGNSSNRLNRKFRLRRDCYALRKSKMFDEEWYIQQNPDVKKAKCDPLEHYVCFGASEGRDPSPMFSTIKYLSLYEDIVNAGVNPLLHYAMYGQKEGRSH